MKKDKNNDKIIIYEGYSGEPRISVRIEGETVWLTQAQMVDLFHASKANISEHTKNIFIENELDKNRTVRKFRTVRFEGNRR